MKALEAFRLIALLCLPAAIALFSYDYELVGMFVSGLCIGLLSSDTAGLTGEL
jgi:fucose permease